jgi:hypothetical protein
LGRDWRLKEEVGIVDVVENKHPLSLLLIA